ncbi:hypothetical protein Dimus_027941, partial [Dionaea muscipula]
DVGEAACELLPAAYVLELYCGLQSVKQEAARVDSALELLAKQASGTGRRMPLPVLISIAR